MNFKSLLTFLKQLSLNNNKEWFEDNRKTYESLRKEWIELAQVCINEVGVFDSQIAGLEAKKCIFRINKDIRFSKDKSPYKTNFGIQLNPMGKEAFCGYYLHVDPKGSFISGGVYLPQGPMLSAIRQEIDYNLDEFSSLLSNKEFKKYFGKLDGAVLSRPPKGYQADNPAIAYLKHKDILATRKLDEQMLLASDFEKELIKTFKAMHPLVQFLRRAVE
jgi:uncharacterized protein (TIGR02453 family)